MCIALWNKVGQYKNPDEHPFFPADLPDGPDPILPPLQYPQVKTKLFFFNKNNWTFVTDTWNLHQILFYGVLPHFDALILSQY